HDGRYVIDARSVIDQTRGGAPGRPLVFVGESRTGVRLKAPAYFSHGASHVELRNLTFDLTGYQPDGSFSTLNLEDVHHFVVSHVSFTGDCATGSRGGHIDAHGVHDIVIEDSIVERFGHCGGGGQMDHGIYFTSGADIVIRNNDIRENA